jgi:hypothetical protein
LRDLAKIKHPKSLTGGEHSRQSGAGYLLLAGLALEVAACPT